MIDLQEMVERHAAALDGVAEAAGRLAMKHADRALETDDPKVEASATAAFQKATRVIPGGRRADPGPRSHRTA